MDGVAAEYIAVSTRYVFRKPANLSHARSRVTPCPLTAWHMLMDGETDRGVRADHAGAAWVSRDPNCKKMAGAKVATAGTDQKVELGETRCR